MQNIIYPAITTNNIIEFQNQFESYLKFSEYIHIDFADGSITPNKLIQLEGMQFTAGNKITLHIMAADPFLYLNQIIKLKPRRVIFPFNISFDNPLFATRLREADIESGIYISDPLELDDAKWQFAHFQEVMLFAGNLGFQGAEANLDLLKIVADIKKFAPFIEIGWDGGVNLNNVKLIASYKIKNIVSGGFITKNGDYQKAYDKLVGML